MFVDLSFIIFRQRREWEKKKKVVLDQVMKDHRMSQNKLPNAF